VFGAILLRGEKFGGERLILLARRAARACALDRFCLDLAVAAEKKSFRRGGDERAFAEIEEGGEGRGTCLAQTQIERIGRIAHGEFRLEALREIGLENVARVDVFDDA